MFFLNKKKNTSEQIKNFIYIFISIISTIFLTEICTKYMDEIKIKRNH